MPDFSSRKEEIGVGRQVILDLKDSDSTVLLAMLHKLISCPNGRRDNDLTSMSLYLVSPQAAILPLVDILSETPAKMIMDEYFLLSTREYQGHVSTENWPEFDSVLKFLGQLKIIVYAISCANDFKEGPRG